VWNHVHTQNVRVDLERSVAALDGMKSWMWLHAHAQNARVDLERASCCFGQTEELDVITRKRTECPRWPREVRRCFGQDEELDISTGRWSDRFVLMAVTRHERSNRQLARGLAGSRRLTIEAGCHLSFHWVELLDHWLWRFGMSVAYTLPASRTRPNVARRCYAPRWLARRQDSRRLALRVKLLCGRFPQRYSGAERIR
jgi:hypothetical protein